MIKLAYFCSEYPSRSHTFIRREIHELRRRGASIDVYALRRPKQGNLISEIDLQEFQQTTSVLPVKFLQLILVHLKMFVRQPLKYLQTLKLAMGHRLPGKKNRLWSLFQFAEGILLAHHLQQKPVQHLHIHFGNVGATVGMIACNYLQLSWSMTLHGTSCFDYPWGALLGAKLERCTFANCISYFGLSQAYRTVGSDHWHKLFVSRCGIELDAVNLAKSNQASIHKDDSIIRLISVGRLHVEKGYPVMINAFASALKSVPNMELVLLGDGPYRKELEAYVKEKGVEQKVVFRGAVPEQTVLDEMVHADIFLLSSFMEGVPMVLMEAMILEVPVIAPRLAGIPELVTCHESGLLFDPAHWQQMAEQIVELARDKKKRASYGAAGREKVLTEFTIEKGVENLWQRFLTLPNLLLSYLTLPYLNNNLFISTCFAQLA
jgi:colanic acid/amylovoran biosynthesis glycosyltransferase